MPKMLPISQEKAGRISDKAKDTPLFGTIVTDTNNSLRV